MKFYFLNILCSGLALGGAFLVRRYLNPPSLEDSSQHYLNFHQQILCPIDTYLLVMSSLADCMALGILVKHHDLVYLSTKLMLEGLICGLVSIIVFLAAIRPIDREFVSWPPDDLPVKWQNRRYQWLKWHTLQAVFSFLAFSFYLFAALAPHNF